MRTYVKGCFPVSPYWSELGPKYAYTVIELWPWANDPIADWPRCCDSLFIVGEPQQYKGRVSHAAGQLSLVQSFRTEDQAWEYLVGRLVSLGHIRIMDVGGGTRGVFYAYDKSQEYSLANIATLTDRLRMFNGHGSLTYTNNDQVLWRTTPTDMYQRRFRFHESNQPSLVLAKLFRDIGSFEKPTGRSHYEHGWKNIEQTITSGAQRGDFLSYRNDLTEWAQREYKYRISLCQK